MSTEFLIVGFVMRNTSTARKAGRELSRLYNGHDVGCVSIMVDDPSAPGLAFPIGFYRDGRIAGTIDPAHEPEVNAANDNADPDGFAGHA